MKDIKNSFLGGIIALMFSQVFIKILGMIHSVYLTNKNGFGDIGNAIYMSGYQIYILILTICSIGVPNTISKMISKRIGINDEYNARKILIISFYIFAVVGFFGSVIMFFGASYFSNDILKIPEAEYTLIALAPSVFFVSTTSVFKGYFLGMKKMENIARVQVYEQFIKTFVTIILIEIVAVLSFDNTKIMASIANIGTTIATITSFIYIFFLYTKLNKKITKNKKERTINIIKEIICLIIPLSLTSFIMAINRNIDSITVVRVLEPIYGNEIAKMKFGIISSKIELLINVPLAFNISIATALIPEISTYKICNDMNNIKRKIEDSLILCLVIAIPCFVGIFLYSNEILNLLFPNANLGGELLKIASFSIIFLALNQTINAALQGMDNIKYPIFALIIGGIIKLILNVTLMRISNILEKGAIISSIISNIIIFLILWNKLNKTCKINSVRIFLKPCILGIMIGIISKLFYWIFEKILISEKILIYIVFIVCVITYIYGIFLLRILKKEDLKVYFNKKSLKY